MNDRLLRIYGIPMDLGQTRRGVDTGPSALRYAGLQTRLQQLGFDVYDTGNIPVPQAEELIERLEPGQARFVPQIAEACQIIYDHASVCAYDNEYAIFLGGDHSISIATVAAVQCEEEVGVLWVDAHGDINTPRTSPSGNVHGMPVSILLGDGPLELINVGTPGAKLKPEQIAMVGIRSLDAGEKTRLRSEGVLVCTMREIDEEGMSAIARRILNHFSPYKRLHVSLDLDSLDPSITPGVGTPVPGGLSYREAHLLMEILSDSGKVRSLDIVEVNPLLDHQNATAIVGVELCASIFGERII